MAHLLIFDLDGVLLSERRYWDCAALTVALALRLSDPVRFGVYPDPDRVETMDQVRRLRELFFPDRVLQSFRKKAVNSNWDKSYAAVLAGLSLSGDGEIAAGQDPEDSGWAPGQRIAKELDGSLSGPLDIWGKRMQRDRLADTVPYRRLADSLEKRRAEGFYDDSASRRDPVSPFGKGEGPPGLFAMLKAQFQRYYLGHPEAATPLLRSGLAEREETIEDREALADALRSLSSAGFLLGIGTGRPRAEARRPLERAGLWSLFSPGHICTFDEVEQEALRRGVAPEGLAKPHPYTFLQALGPCRDGATVIGDSPADLLAARDAGLGFIGVGRPGVFGPEQAYAQAVVPSAIDLPGALSAAWGS